MGMLTFCGFIEGARDGDVGDLNNGKGIAVFRESFK